VVVGVILLLAGIVFSLQGMNIITGSSVMSGVSEYIYIGAVVAVVGLVLLFLGLRSGTKVQPQAQMGTTGS